MERIAEAGAGFRSITEHIDTTTPAGWMMMQMVGSFAEFERAMIREHTSADQVALARCVLEEGTAAGEVARSSRSSNARPSRVSFPPTPPAEASPGLRERQRPRERPDRYQVGDQPGTRPPLM